MILIDDFFFIRQQEITSSTLQTKITFNRDHKIFDGHFPGMPVVPGVCMVQIMLEIMQKHLLKPVRIASAESIKFLAVIAPDESNEIELMINYTSEREKLFITASLFSGTTTFFKLKGTLIAA